MKKITIAIDGYSSCGKSTMAKDLARRIGYVYVDTGAMYRAVTLFALRNGLFNADGSVNIEKLEHQMPNIAVSFQFNQATQKPDTYLNGELVEKEIRSLEVSNHVSLIAAVPFVREAMVEQQQAMGQEGGIVMDGRDIGTTVFPECRTENLRHSLGRGSCATPLRRTRGERDARTLRGNPEKRAGTRLSRHAPRSFAAPSGRRRAVARQFNNDHRGTERMADREVQGEI